ncbi:MAG: hypothetical protein ACYSOK_04385, partial [Planctomycetota bacterium]
IPDRCPVIQQYQEFGRGIDDADTTQTKILNSVHHLYDILFFFVFRTRAEFFVPPVFRTGHGCLQRDATFCEVINLHIEM